MNRLKSFYKNLPLFSLTIIVLQFFVLLIYSCNKGNDIPKLEVLQNTDSLAIEFYKTNSYLKFINHHLIPRERNSKVSLYENKILDISFAFKRIGNDIKVKEEIAVQLDSIYGDEWKNELEDIKVICNSMDKYTINSFWGVFPDSSAEKLSITFENYERVYFRTNDSSYKKNLNLRLSDTIYYDEDWILLK